MSSKLDKMFITAQLGHLEQDSSFWARKKWTMFSLRMSSKLDKTFRTDQLGHLEHHSSFWARKKGIFFPLQMRSKLDKTFRTAKLGHLEHHSSFWAKKKMKLFFAPNELKTWLNVQNGSVRPFGALQLILSEKKIWNIVSLRMRSKLNKTFRTAKLGHLEHHSSF